VSIAPRAASLWATAGSGRATQAALSVEVPRPWKALVAGICPQCLPLRVGLVRHGVRRLTPFLQ